MKHGQDNQNSQKVQPANQTPKPVEATKEPSKEVFVVNSISELIAQVEKAGGTLSAEAKVELEKMRTAQETLEAPKRLANAEAELTEAVVKLLETIAAKHKVSFSGRKMVVVVKSETKEGEKNPLVSFGPEVEVVAAKKQRASNGSGFKSHGAVVAHPEPGKEVHFGSFGAMAKAMNWKMEGRANATVAITNPITQAEWDKMDSEARKNLPTLNRIETKEENGKTIQHVYPVIAS